MFDFIKGGFSYKNFSDKGFYAVIETCGVGYILELMQRDYDILPSEGSELKLYTVLIHREDKMCLCGFLKREDRDIFNVLTSVSGVGSKMAITLLNSFKVSNLVEFVIDGNYKELTRAKGVGTKLAQKIILELKDKLTSFKDTKNIMKTNNFGPENKNIEDAKMVLLSLGYDKNEIENAISKSVQILSENSSAENILKKALQILSL